MGLVNEGTVAFEAEEALSEGMLVTFGTAAGKVKRAVDGDHIIGVVAKTTAVGEMAPIVLRSPGKIVNILLETDNQAISYGNGLCITADATEKGQVDLRDGVNETGAIIAYALEGKALNAGGLIKAQFA